MQRLIALVFASTLVGCSTQEPARADKTEPAPSAASLTADSAASTSAPRGSAVARENKFGAPIGASAFAKLSDIAADPAAYDKKTIKTEGTVTAVCQHMGCWMEIESDTKEAHIKMAQHSFFVPKDASGRRALIEGSVAAHDGAQGGACGHEHEGDAKHDDCGGSAKAASARVEIEATGVEFVD